MFDVDPKGLLAYAAALEARTHELAPEVERALDKIAALASAAGQGKGAYPWTHPEWMRRVIYHTPWFLRFVEGGRDAFATGGRSGSHNHNKVFHFMVAGKDVFTRKVGPIQARGDTMVSVQRAAEAALPRFMSSQLGKLLST